MRRLDQAVAEISASVRAGLDGLVTLLPLLPRQLFACQEKMERKVADLQEKLHKDGWGNGTWEHRES